MTVSQMLRKAVAIQVKALGENEVEIVMSTPELARDGHVLVPQGCILDNYRKNPIQLWNHDPEHPVGTNDNIAVTPDGVSARTIFAPMGISAKADEIRGLVKAGVIRTVSVGFLVLECEPLDPRKPRGGQRITKWELLECSFVSIPSDTDAIVAARAKGDNDMAEEWKVGAARDLPIEDSDDWDGGEAEVSIFEFAGGDDFDPVKARRGFLFYDAAAPKKRGSYKVPIAREKDGKLVVPKGGLRAAASRLPQTDVPEDVKKKGEAVLAAYKKKAKIGDDEGDKERSASYRRMFGRPVQKRGLFEVAQLCWLMDMLNGQAHAARIEQALEGDESDVPELMLEALKAVGAALMAMAPEEVGEILEGHDVDEDELEELDEEERKFVLAARSPLARAFRKAMVGLRKGKVLSKSNTDKLEEADGHHDRALRHHRSVGASHEEVGNRLEKARAAHRAAKSALEETKSAPTEDGVERCMRHVRAIGEHLDGAADHHADAVDGHRSLGRSVRSARRCVREVLGTAVEGDDDLNPEKPTDDDEAARGRRAKALSLRAKARPAA